MGPDFGTNPLRASSFSKCDQSFGPVSHQRGDAGKIGSKFPAWNVLHDGETHNEIRRGRGKLSCSFRSDDAKLRPFVCNEARRQERQSRFIEIADDIETPIIARIEVADQILANP
jgi:hypothetical protein